MHPIQLGTNSPNDIIPCANRPPSSATRIIRPKQIKFPPKLLPQIARTGRHGSHATTSSSHEAQIGHARAATSSKLLININHPHAMRPHAHAHHDFHAGTHALILPLGMQAPHDHHLVAGIASIDQIIAQFDEYAAWHASHAGQCRCRFLHLHLLVVGVFGHGLDDFEGGGIAPFVEIVRVGGADDGLGQCIVRRAKVGIDRELAPASLAETLVRS
mmetsp:Transcript_1488/g.3137  ORF Transcript_1488/g.3137 Transcript_1488/m.3137 type:complete len:216 (+) Transcript_1488:1970-2617(+)